MSPLDYLRTRTRRGAAERDVRIRVEAAASGRVEQAAASKPAPSREHTAQIAAQATAAVVAERVARNCPCIAIYSECRCGRAPKWTPEDEEQARLREAASEYLGTMIRFNS